MAQVGITQVQKDLFVKYYKQTFNKTMAAAMSGAHKSTFETALKEDIAFKQQFETAKAELQFPLLTTAFKMATDPNNPNATVLIRLLNSKLFKNSDVQQLTNDAGELADFNDQIIINLKKKKD